ncbi:MAG TPA: right-handed parallel beta-helix repeat-containing protein [Blastocatellia bacterium]|nr:right-handed parallel beta-helix repeat-containing protein [Blastocatellia bacterium]
MLLAWAMTLAPLPWPVPPVMAATFTVTSTADNLISDGLCTLREAIRAANDAASNDCGTGSVANDTIILQLGQTYTLSLEDSGTPGDEDAAAEDDLDIENAMSAGTLTIQGSGATIRRDPTLACSLNGTDAVGEFRIFEVLTGGDLTLQNVTVTNGCADDADGGGILNDGTLTIQSSTISNNITDGVGGGIDDDGGTVTITNSTISNNTADEDGGGIFNDDEITITNSTISDNTADDDGGGIDNFGTVDVTNSTISDNSADDDGGGIRNFGTVTLTNSTISDNSANGDGGGIWNDGVMDITNSTISGNHADQAGGGIYNDFGEVEITDSTISGNSANNGGGIRNGGSGATMTIEGSTISGNRADDVGGGIRNFGAEDVVLTIINSTISGNETGGSSGDDGGGIWNGATVDASFVTIANNNAGTSGQGGGIFNGGTDPSFTIKNSIVGNNSAGGGGANCFDTGAGDFSADGENLDTDGSCATLDPDFTQVASTGAGGLNLGPLANNGGPTQTHALQAGSAAIDAVTTCTDLMGNNVTTDQRGVTNVRTLEAPCDVGAYEARLVTLDDDGSARCLEVERDTQTYAFDTVTSGILLGRAQVTARGTTELIRNIGGNRLVGTVSTFRGVRRGVATLTVPSVRRIFTIRDGNLANTAHGCF